MNESPLVSVVMPVYNAGEYLRPALGSIVQQTYKSLEIIVVDDGSTDGCIETIRDLTAGDGRVRILEQQNAGKAVALNHALETIKGEYWAIQDADDVSYPERIQRQLQVLVNRPELAAVYVGHDLLLSGRRFAPTFEGLSVAECKELNEQFTMPAHDATGMYRVNMVRQLRFDPELIIGQGIDYVLRVGERHPIAVLGDCLYTYRINYASTIRKNPQKNMEFVNRAIEKACSRRGVDFEKQRLVAGKEYKTRKRSSDNHLVNHCIKSVRHLKHSKRFAKAWEVGLICCLVRPLDYYYYKPVICCTVPDRLIDAYQAVKQRKRIRQ